MFMASGVEFAIAYLKLDGEVAADLRKAVREADEKALAEAEKRGMIARAQNSAAAAPAYQGVRTYTLDGKQCAE